MKKYKSEFIQDRPETGLLSNLDRAEHAPESQWFYYIPKENSIAVTSRKLPAQSMTTEVERIYENPSLTRALRRARLG